MLRKEKRTEILTRLEKEYLNTKTALNYHSPFELLVAVILSAQCTDERVNVITARIFPRLNTPKKMLKLSLGELEEEIRDCGLYHAKAKNLLGMAKMLHEEFKDVIPKDIETMMQLPGVGRKTANVVASVIYNIPAIAVDTHVFRVSHRLGLAKGKTPEETELELQKIIPKEKWGKAHHWLIWHGRLVCKARKPECETCILQDLCPMNK
ncbi:MAG: endonuclease III [Acidaminococcaceae bacterium]|nr:endonuclease III [Acidaminococcaceae bacterium]MDO4935835.1 endonuclease III [Phascolarctobacterium sp.]